MKNLYWVLAALLILVAIGISALVVYITTTRTLTPVESILWQILVFAFGLAGSFIFGRQSAKEAAKEMIKPHVRSAFRRLLSLYQSLSRAATTIESAQISDSPENDQVALARLEEIIAEQLSTADAALEDWRDIVPEDVGELEQKRQFDNTRREEK